MRLSRKDNDFPVKKSIPGAVFSKEGHAESSET